ncbi:MAG TPA: sugar ABC transporter permease [Ruminiclostridium sp.]
MKKKIYPFYFILGALVLYLVFIVIPGIVGIVYSFTDWSSYSKEVHFVGLDNFKIIFSKDENYFKYIFNSIEFTFITTIAKLVIATVLALILNENIKARNMHRALIFMPAILSMIITGLVFKSILNPESGLLNQILRSIGLGSLAQQWLVDLKFAFNSVMAVDTWKGIGYTMTIILAGLQSISPSYYEAADIDGAHYFSKLKYITLPLLRPAINVTIVLGVLYGLKVFDIIYALTNGGPGYATEVVSTSIFKDFGLGRYAVASTMNTVMIVFMVIVGMLTVKMLTKEEVNM